MTYNHTHRPRRTKRRTTLVGLAACASLMLLPGGQALAGNGGVSATGDKGGPTVGGKRAKLRRNGTAVPPRSAPRRVKRAIRAGNRIDDKPYKYGGGHRRWNDRGYDCSGAVSYVLGKRGAKLIRRPMISGDYARWGRSGKGKWITVYGDSSHVFVVVAGLRFDTSQPDDGRSGPGWSKDIRAGFRNVSRKAAQHHRRF